METTYERFINSVKRIKPSTEEEFDSSKFLYQLLDRIEFSSKGDYEGLIASASTDLAIVKPLSESKQLSFFLRNYIRFFMIAFEIMVSKAEQVAKDDQKQLDKPDRLSMVFYQKKLSRALLRMATVTPLYEEFIKEYGSADTVETFANIELNAFIFLLNRPNTYKLVFTGITRGFRHDPETNGYKHIKNIETLF